MARPRTATGLPAAAGPRGVAAAVGEDRAAWGTGLSDVLALFRSSDSLTRADVMAVTGLSRTTVGQRLDALLAADLVTATAGGSTGGRPAERFRFHPERGVLLACDVGATAFRAALCDLSGAVLDESAHVMDVSRGPRPVLKAVDTRFATLLRRAGRAPADVLGIGLDVPGPVDFATGRVVSPPIMTDWDGFDIPGWFAERYAAPVLVDKDVNAMAVGERQECYPDVDDLMLVKIGTGVGSGLIAGGRVHRGADGAAGDIGHIQLGEGAADAAAGDPPECRCGNRGCVEAYAGGWALVRDLQAAGRDVSTVDDAVNAIRSGDIAAQRLLRTSGRILGRAIADAVNLVNPRVVAVGGQLAHVDEQLLAGIREVVYRRSLPLATRDLLIVRSRLDPRAGVVGLAHLLADELFTPARLAALVGR
ncbi:ROK family transcriptional regulator [Jatrophihabitans endophyticus]|nr:ROK family protein [Jatrophihabitans endophyticus]